MVKKEQQPTQEEIQREVDKLPQSLSSEKNIFRIYKRAFRLLDPKSKHPYLSYLSTETTVQVESNNSLDIPTERTDTKSQILQAHSTLLRIASTPGFSEDLIQNIPLINNGIKGQTELHRYRSNKKVQVPFSLLDIIIHKELPSQETDLAGNLKDRYSQSEKKALLAVTIGYVQTQLVDEIHDPTKWSAHDHKREKVRKRAIRDLVLNHARLVFAVENQPNIIEELAHAKITANSDKIRI